MDRHVLLDLGPHRRRVGLPVAPLEQRHDPLELPPPAVTRPLALEREVDLLLAAAVEEDLADLLRQPPPGGGEPEGHRLGEVGHHPHAHRPRAGRPGSDGAGVDRALGVGDHLVGVDAADRPQPRAVRAGAVGAVEREQARGDLGQPAAALGAGVVLRQGLLGGALGGEHDQAAGHLERGLQRVGEPLLHPLADHQPVDDDVDGVLLLLVERRRVGGEVDHRAVDPRADEALAGHLGELLLVLPLLPADVGGVDHQPRPRRQAHHPVDHLLHRLRADRLAAGRAVRHPDRGVEQAQVVVDLGDRAHRRAGVLRHRLLLDRDRRRQPLDGVDVGLLHLLEELPGVGRQRLDVAPLAFGEQGVEGQRGLARPRHPGDHHQPVAGDVEVEVLEVVLAGAANRDRIHGAKTLAARGRSPHGRAQGSCGRRQGARRKRCGDIVDDERRRMRPQDPCALRVAAAWGHLPCRGSSTMAPHRLRRRSEHLAPRRSQRGHADSYHGLLAVVSNETGARNAPDSRRWRARGRRARGPSNPSARGPAGGAVAPTRGRSAVRWEAQDHLRFPDRDDGAAGRRRAAAWSGCSARTGSCSRRRR